MVEHPARSLLTDLADDFAAAGLAGRLTLGARPALVVVDPARAYTEPDSALYAGVEDAVEQMKVLLAAARAAAIPVYFTRVLFEHPGDGGRFADKVPAAASFRAGDPLALPIEGLEHRDGEVVITKQYPSAFFGTALASSLARQAVDTVLIAGLSTSGCVRATALDALQSGFVPVVVREAVGDRHPEPHESNLRDIQAKIGEVRSIDEMLAYLAGGDR
ncbi:isochorismatase family protein [Microbacterium hatanonis]|uniref:Isochorismatase family protein n=1 Tax=Microbacterium hatanonis TaxID=404366 RepID=A0A5C8I0J9_9MICO|nr:isochorismatase family protein [Microbacterium hatanonis]TXK12467.1 isochorismatase family protein [Microbacterium hatanonis]